MGKKPSPPKPTQLEQLSVLMDTILKETKKGVAVLSKIEEDNHDARLKILWRLSSVSNNITENIVKLEKLKMEQKATASNDNENVNLFERLKRIAEEKGRGDAQ